MDGLDSKALKMPTEIRKPLQQFLLFFLIFTQLSIIICSQDELAASMDCVNISNTSQTVKLFAKSKKGAIGKWVDSFAALANTSMQSENVFLEVTHKVAECGDRRIIYIQGVTNSDASPSFTEKLFFHPKTGKNVALSNNGRTAQKINLDDGGNSIVFTNRPLRDNEIFEIRLESKNTKFSTSLGLGICTSSPDDINITPSMWTSPIAWMLHHSSVHHNGKEILKPYGRSIDGLQVGERLGVMRNKYGVIHYFVNGVDQGPAASSIPKDVYGVLDLYNNAVKATIMEADPISS